ncbi:AMP-binding protein, partial [Pelomonas sp. KK5]|uniref:AMP-binding protein n=1 Tax=Pelomonas sp. KK5 TaxID=1855730 RepID=UPI0011806D89
MTSLSPQQIAQRSHFPRRLPREVVVPKTSLYFNLQVSATRYPDKAAAIYCGKTTTYAELHAQALALAGWLKSVGVGKGDRVALFLQNCPQFLVAVYAVNRADAVVVPVNPMNKAEEFGHYITDPSTKVVICSADLAGIVAQANEALPADRRISSLLVTRYADDVPADAGLSEPMRQWVTADGVGHQRRVGVD